MDEYYENPINNKNMNVLENKSNYLINALNFLIILNKLLNFNFI